MDLKKIFIHYISTNTYSVYERSEMYYNELNECFEIFAYQPDNKTLDKVITVPRSEVLRIEQIIE